MALPLIRKDSVRRPGSGELRKLLNAFRGGCYLLRLSMKGNPWGTESKLSGTMRVERAAKTANLVNFRVSADLYAADAGNGRQGRIPVFPRSDYRAYLTLAKDAIWLQRGRLKVKMRSARLRNTSWSGAATVKMYLKPRNAREPSFAVELRKGASVVGQGDAIWIGPEFRCLTIRTAKTDDSSVPFGDGAGVTWESLFRDAGWTVRCLAPNTVAHPSDRATWTPAELHAQLDEWSDSGATLDDEWFVLLLCVREISAFSKRLRGIMFDFGDADENGVPREASAVASGWPIPDDDRWGDAKGKAFGDYLPLYFRTAAHEIGHALSLIHPTVASVAKIMSATNELIGKDAFPDRLPMRMSADERKWMCHSPDPVVRPGGLPFPSGGAAVDLNLPEKVVPTSMVRLIVEPLLQSYPRGAPVRLHFELENRRRKCLATPARFGFSELQMGVSVTGPDKVARHVKSTVAMCDELDWTTLETKASQDAAMTLFRNHTEPLFPEPGVYLISVTLRLSFGREMVIGRTSLNVSDDHNVDRCQKAQRALDSRGIQQLLTVGGDYGEPATELMKSVLRDDVLAPHFQYIEAKRIGSCFFSRRSSLSGMARCLKRNSVMTHQEIERAIDVISQGINDGSRAYTSACSLIAILKTKTRAVRMLKSTEQRLRRRLDNLTRRIRRRQTKTR